MDLFKLEHKKLWRRWSVRISTALCFLYVVLLGGFLSYQSGFGSPDYEDGYRNKFDGYSNIRLQTAYAQSFGPVLTDESLQSMVRDFQRLYAQGEGFTNAADHNSLNTLVYSLWPETMDPSDYRSPVYYTDPEKLSGLYERRQEALLLFLETSTQNVAERDYLLSLDGGDETPYKWGYIRGWATVTADMAGELGRVLALFLALALAPVFSGERQSSTRDLLLSTKKGGGSLARAKCLSSLCFVLELFFLCAGGAVMVQLIYFGAQGWDLPVQLIKPIAIAPMNMLQAEIYEYACTLLGALGFCGAVLLISSRSRNNFSALAGSLALVYLPMALAGYLPFWAQKLLDLIPLTAAPTDIFRTYTYSLFGRYVWSPYVIISVPVVLGLVCLAPAAANWKKRARV